MILNESEREHERTLILGGHFPHFPILPVKRDQDEGGLGLLLWHLVPSTHDDGNAPWRVYLANLVELSLRHEGTVTVGEFLKDVPYIEYPTLDEFFDAGWRGD